ncbi:MAG TPA: hypothetical protein VMS00_13955 [Acidimicrobiales bacterium]|nr:hypothetical protein [Acidimicrobiales bacterium]
MRTILIRVAVTACALPLVIGVATTSITGRDIAELTRGGDASIADGNSPSRATALGDIASGAQGVLALPGGVVWSLNSGGQIVRSTDSGAQWRTAFPTWAPTPTSLQLTGAFFLDAEDAWAVTAHEWPAQPGVTTVWRTTDGGASWHQGRSLPGMLTDYGALIDQLDFADLRHGFAFSVSGDPRDDTLWVTSDGGMNWRRVGAVGLPWQGSTVPIGDGPGCTAEDPFALTAASAGVLLLTDDLCPTTRPGTWLSEDAGRNWVPVHLPAPPGGWRSNERWRYPGSAGQPTSGAEVLSGRYFSQRTGVISVTTRPGELLVYLSHDTGASWRLASLLMSGSLSRPSGFGASSPSTWELPAPAGLYTTRNAGQQWQLQRSSLSLPTMAQVSFASPETGIWVSGSAIGPSGLRTTNGGKSWQPVVLPGAASSKIPFNTVDFPTRTQGWVGGADGVEATANGGMTWTAQLQTTSPVQELSFVDAQHGWALTADQLFATADGGEHWAALPETELGAFRSVQLVSPDFGVALVCEAGGTRALATLNEGGSWAPLPVPQSNDLNCGGYYPPPGQNGGLCFGNALTGWAVLHPAGGMSGTVELSSDGGQRWAPVASFTPSPAQVACQGASQVWLGLNWMDNMSGGGDLAESSDGGRSWRIGELSGPAAAYAPHVKPADGSVVQRLGPAPGPAASAFWEPSEGLLSPGPGDLVDLWQNGGAGCYPGNGLLVTMGTGATWTVSTEGTTPSEACGGTGLPYLSTGSNQEVNPSLSFPDPEDGFVLGQAGGARAVPKGGNAPITMALIGTPNAGKSWSLLTRFMWHTP